MTVYWKYLLAAAFAAGALLSLHAAVRSIASNVQRLSSWRRFPATVYSSANPSLIEVRVGSGPEERTLKVPCDADTGYWPGRLVTVLENPRNPEDRRLTGFLDLWNSTLVASIFFLALFLAALWIASSPWGLHAVWSGGRWLPSQEIDRPPEFEVFEPRLSWKANLFWGCVLGLVTGLPSFFAEGIWTPWRALWAVVGLGIFTWATQNAILNYSRSVRLTDAGIEERSFFGSRRVPWEELGGIEFQDVRKAIEDINTRDRAFRKLSTLPRIDVWAVLDRQGRNVFSLPAEMTPSHTLTQMRQKIDRYARRR